MSLLNPKGLLALLWIAVLLILFLVRPKYREMQVSSIYLWRLSQKYLKTHALLHKWIRNLLLLCQMLLIALAALMLSQPRLTARRENSEYVAIIDTSASMREADAEGLSRMEAAKRAVGEHMKTMGLSCHITLITTEAGANLLLERGPSPVEAERVLKQIACSWAEADVNGAVNTAQEILDAYPQSEIYLYTDHDYAFTENIQVVNVARDREEWNAALSALEGRFSPEGTVLTHNVVSYGRDAEVTLGLYVNGRLTAAQRIPCKQDEPATVSWNVENGLNLTEARVVIDAEDGLREDNETYLFRQNPGTLKVQLIGESTLYWETGLSVFPQLTLTLSKTPESALKSGFDLYIYDGCAPQALPADGAVCLIGAQSLPGELGLQTGKVIRGGYLSQARKIRNVENRPLVEGVSAGNIAVQKFLEVEPNERYTTVLQCGEMPALLAGSRENGTACMVMTFDLHDSNLPMLPDFISLLNHMLDYILPDMLDDDRYTVAQRIEARAVPLCEAVWLSDPQGEKRELERVDRMVPFSVEMPGAYTLLESRSVGEEKSCRFFAALSERESDIRTNALSDGLYLERNAKNGENTNQTADAFNPTAYLAIATFLLLVAECVVYNHERY